MMTMILDGVTENFSENEWAFIKKQILENSIHFFVDVKEMTDEYPDSFVDEENPLSEIETNKLVFSKLRSLGVNVCDLDK